MDPVMNHFGNWVGVALWIVIYGVVLAFVPFYKKSQAKPASVYLAFIVAYALEMFGVPLSMFFIAWALGQNLPDGILWGHTLNQYIGHWGMYVGVAMGLTGAALIVFGWRIIYKRYWSQETGQGELVREGVYRYIRHPQYTGFMLMSLGAICEWATLPLIILWPILAVVYYRLARKEERDMLKEFGPAYEAYRQTTGMFLPKLSRLWRTQPGQRLARG